jgi:hypothetical protein
MKPIRPAFLSAVPFETASYVLPEADLCVCTLAKSAGESWNVVSVEAGL